METAQSRPAIIAVLSECRSFILRPRRVVSTRKANWSDPAPAWAVLGWCSALVVAMFGTYSLLFGSLLTNLSSLDEVTLPAEDPQAVESQEDSIRLAEWGLTWRLGIRVDFPQGLEIPITSPQKARFRFGFTDVVFENVVPAKLGRGSFPLLAQALYALLLVLCLYPIARLLGGVGSFADTIRATILFFAYTVVAMTLLLIGCTLLTVHTIDIPLWLISVCWLLLVQLPVLVSTGSTARSSHSRASGLHVRQKASIFVERLRYSGELAEG